MGLRVLARGVRGRGGSWARERGVRGIGGMGALGRRMRGRGVRGALARERGVMGIGGMGALGALARERGVRGIGGSWARELARQPHKRPTKGKLEPSFLILCIWVSFFVCTFIEKNVRFLLEMASSS